MLLRTPIDLGSAIRDRRRALHLDQNELASQVGVSRKWIIDAEKGKSRAEIGLLLRTLDVLGLRLSLDAGGPIAGQNMVPTVDIDAVLDRARGQP
ncbi:MAG TPA: helix-turn-helix domain-containing protein [Xanthobacteraceae bacterium]|jgi:HTH-type transcriptional regulator/antitoxin HipB